MSGNIIEHQGIVASIDGRHIQVQISQTSACAGCQVKVRCNAAESKDKLIDVMCETPDLYHVGDSVLLVGDASVGIKAVWLAFFLPFLFLLAALLLCYLFTRNEALSALAGIVILLPYYYTLYRTRDRWAGKFTFTIKSNNN